MIQTARATSLCLVCTRCRRARGEGWRDGKEGEFFLWAHSSWMEFLTYAAGMPGMQDSLIQPRRRKRRRNGRRRAKRTDWSGKTHKKRVWEGGGGGGQRAKRQQWLKARIPNTAHHCGRGQSLQAKGARLSRHGTNKWFSFQLRRPSQTPLLTVQTNGDRRASVRHGWQEGRSQESTSSSPLDEGLTPACHWNLLENVANLPSLYPSTLLYILQYFSSHSHRPLEIVRGWLCESVGLGLECVLNPLDLKSHSITSWGPLNGWESDRLVIDEQFNQCLILFFFLSYSPKNSQIFNWELKQVVRARTEWSDINTMAQKVAIHSHNSTTESMLISWSSCSQLHCASEALLRVSWDWCAAINITMHCSLPEFKY